MVKSIKIENLFEIFDYDIKYPDGENVMIITGPNGFGKTQILNILFNLFNRKFLFFYKLVFDKITVFLSDNISIQIIKVIEENNQGLNFYFFDGDKQIASLPVSAEANIADYIESKYSNIRELEPGKWFDRRYPKILSSAELIAEYADEISIKLPTENEQIKNILNSLNVHIIREQRLFKKVSSSERDYRRNIDKEQTVMTNTIQIYSEELRDLITDRIKKYTTEAQSLDSSYTKRLISEQNLASKEEYDLKSSKIKTKQEKLQKNGLYENTQDELGYSENDAKALWVYLNDLEKKLSVFDDLLVKLELFTDILNKRRFTYKSIKISKDKGFYFEMQNGKELNLNELSSGEQHEVIMLYELIFKTEPNILVLIDEPEISLHITWQKKFVTDILKIIDIQQFQVLIATHAPGIINDRWDLVYNLEKSEA